jgi:hypothetical protein
MNFSLDNNVNKLVLLLVVGVVLLLLIHMYKQKLGEQVSVLLSVVVLVVCGYFGYVLLNSPDENFNPNESVSPIYENYENKKHLEHFENAQEEHDEHLEHEGEEEHEEPDEQEEHKEYFANHKDHKDHKEHFGKHVEHFQSNEPGANTGELNSEPLFPSGEDCKWSKVVPNNDGDANCKSLLNAGHHIGVNTTGCSMRNANRGLRSEPPNPQVQVSPWLQTTICPDPFRKPLDGC